MLHSLEDEYRCFLSKVSTFSTYSEQNSDYNHENDLVPGALYPRNASGLISFMCISYPFTSSFSCSISRFLRD
jgi:hypothetical protein